MIHSNVSAANEQVRNLRRGSVAPSSVSRVVSQPTLTVFIPSGSDCVSAIKGQFFVNGSRILIIPGAFMYLHAAVRRSRPVPLRDREAAAIVTNAERGERWDEQSVDADACKAFFGAKTAARRRKCVSDGRGVVIAVTSCGQISCCGEAEQVWETDRRALRWIPRRCMWQVIIIFVFT